MELGRGRSRPPWRDASGEGGLWPLCQAVYAVTIPTWLGGVGGAAIPTSGAVGGGGARRPAERAFIYKITAGCMPQHAQTLFIAGARSRLAYAAHTHLTRIKFFAGSSTVDSTRVPE